MPGKQVPPLKRKKTHNDIGPDSLTAALNWPKIAKEFLSDAAIPFASNEGIVEQVEEGDSE